MAAAAGIGGLGVSKLPMPSLKKISIEVLSEYPDEEDVKSMLQLSKTIFGNKEEDTPTHHSSLTEWQQRLRRPGAIIIYAALHVSRRDLQDKVSATPVGYMFGYRKEQTMRDGTEAEAAHVWLAGVHDNYQGQCVFRDMLKVFEQYGMENQLGLMSIATYPTKFNRMYGLLRKTGWEEMSRNNEKVVLVKVVNCEERTAVKEIKARS